MAVLSISLSSVYSGTVAGAREAFFNDIPAISVSYDWVKGKSNVHDFILAAQACIPIISAVLVEIKNQSNVMTIFAICVSYVTNG
ncbi:hypothetical protein HN51_066129 [Arachis hypogaea]